MQKWPKIDPGAMVHQVSILKQQAGTDISGTVVQWVPFVTTWAAIDTVSGTDVLRSGQDTTKVYLRVKIRWQTGILPSMRLQKVDGTQFVIQAIENVSERNVILVLFCLAIGLGY